MTKVLLATRNLHKVQEIQTMLGGTFECVCLMDFPGVPEVVEDAATFEGNARKKAETLAAWLARTVAAEGAANHGVECVLADDSGLEVDALEGAPGVCSARFAALDSGVEGNSSDADNNAKLLKLLSDVPQEKRTARFRCVIALLPLNPRFAIGNPQSFDGACEGRIGFELRGEHGFGYDPLFIPVGFEQTFAQLGEETKNRISHRSQALAKLREKLSACG